MNFRNHFIICTFHLKIIAHKFLNLHSCLVCVLLLFAFSTKAQNSSSHFKCGTETLEKENYQKQPELLLRTQKLEEAYLGYMQKKNNPTPSFLQSKSSTDTLITLPVVVHIIHNNGPENITDAQVLKGIKDLNDAYANKGYYDPNTGVNTYIQFCLALRDTSDEGTSGIVRHNSPLTDMSIHHSHDSIVKLATWNTKEYINIRLVRMACNGSNCNIAGYSTLPSSAGEDTDGIVMDAHYFGSSPKNGVVITHEMGHYLGLRHTFFFECKNDNCLTDGDKVCDTPPDKSSEHISCNFSLNSCSTDEDDPSTNNPFRSPSLGGLGDQDDHNENYMDYSAYDCYNQFSPGQKERMRFFISEARSSLMRSKACLAPCEVDPIASFTVDKDSILSGDIVTITNQSSNASIYKWFLNGDLFSQSEDTSIQLIEPGYHTIRLEAWNGDIACEYIKQEVIVKVVCPVQADFSYEIKNDWIIFNDESQNHMGRSWTLRRGDGSALYTSTASIDSFDITNLLYLQICIESNNEYCKDEYCEFIRLVRDGVEICDNQIDDDGDGYIDQFDPDCPCDSTAYQAQCPIDCEYDPKTYPDFSMKLAWESPLIGNGGLICPNIVVGDINSDGSIEVITRKTFYAGGGGRTESYISIIDGASGDSILEFKVSDSRPYIQSRELISIADIDHNGISEIIFKTEDHIKVYNIQGDLLYQSDSLLINRGKHINIADFNGDGKAEFYLGASIFNAENAKLLSYSNQSSGQNPPPNTSGWYYSNEEHSIAADLLPAPGLELAAGNMVYKVELNNLNDTIGNKMTPVIAEDPVKDGFTSVADIDGDGQLDVIVVRGHAKLDDGGIWVWNPRTRKIIASSTDFFDNGSVPLVGDVDGDCVPEIAVVSQFELRVFKYTGSKDLKLLYKKNVTETSGMTGITMFDFNQDGLNELIYRDHFNLQIMNGASGDTIASFPIESGTWTESPIVADIDLDGEAELLVNGWINDHREIRIFCFESSGAPWATSRSVWNQPGYHVTNINDDLTVPRYPQNHAQAIVGTDSCLRETCNAPYNAFMTQATLRTQEGCIQIPAVDLSLDVLSYECTPDSLFFYLIIKNLSKKDLNNTTLKLAAYSKLPVSPSNLLNVSSIQFTDDSSTSQYQTSDTVKIAYSILTGLEKIYFAINDAGNGANAENLPVTGIGECNYDNNLDSINVDLDPLILDLGPDITKCKSEIITFNAGSDFKSYVWSNGRRDSVYSASYAGVHYVVARDNCNRKYTDTVQIIIDTLADINLGPDKVICKNDGNAAIYLEDNNPTDSLDYDFIQWLPRENVDCDTCQNIRVQSDTSLSIIVLAGKDECISTDTLHIEFRPHHILYDSISVCQGEGSIIYRDSTIFEPGLYEFEINDCDSSLILDFKVNTHDSTFITESICQGDSIYFGGNWINKEGQYLHTLKNARACDSLVYLNLSIKNSIQAYDTISICEQDSIFLYDQWISTNTSLEKTFTSTGGCDSTQHYYISVLPLPERSFSLEICEGDSVQIHENWISEAGNQTIRVKNNNACDSLLHINCIKHPIQTSSDSIILCEGDSIRINNQWVRNQGKYIETFTGSSGCDSIVETHVNLIQNPPPPESEVDCQNFRVSVMIDANSPWRIQWENGDTTRKTSFTTSDSTRVKLYAEPNCEIEYVIDLPRAPVGNSIPDHPDTTVVRNDSLTIHLKLDPSQWTIAWTPREIFTCDTCLLTQLVPDQTTTVEGHFTHSSGCIFTTRFMLRIESPPKPYIPNIFTPNGDGRNDVFEVIGQDFELLDLEIYDRWGQRLFSSNNKFDNWDGTFRGRDVVNGVYVYKLVYRNAHDERIRTTGDVTVLR